MATSASWLAVLAALAALGLGHLGAEGRKGFGDGGQEFGYVDVRAGAHMFYWLFYAGGGDAPAGKPLVIWLQGGPGAASTSFGNFNEIGPLDAHLNKRNTSWVDYVNVLFIDNPVGTGYSYVDDSSLLTTTNKQIADDLVAFTKSFMNKYPQFKATPLYVFCESYGGKMTAEFALNLFKEQKAGRVASNLKAVALGDSWISPIDSVMTWAPFLLHMGMVDSRGYDKIMEAALETKDAVDAGRWDEATNGWQMTERVVQSRAMNVDFYNILTPIRATWHASSKSSAAQPQPQPLMVRSSGDDDVDLNELMDSQVKPALGVIPSHVRHRYSSGAVFSALRTDFMKPVTHVVEQLLNDTDVQVAVLTGQLDLIVDTPGTLAWAERLRWSRADYWGWGARREAVVVHGVIEGFVKQAGPFSFYWVNRAGHMVPSDNPAAAIEILRRVTRLK